MAKSVVSTTLNFGLVSAPVAVKKCSGRTGTEFKSATEHDAEAGYVWADKAAIQDAATTALANGKQPSPAELGKAILEIPFALGDKGRAVQKPRKGIFDGDGFTEVPVDAIAAIDEECKLPDLSIEGFIPLADVPLERSIGAYFLAPAGKGGAAAVKPLALLRDGLKMRKTAGFGRLTLRTKTYPFVVYERNGGLLLNTLEYAADFAQSSEAAECLSGIATDEKTLQLAGALIDQLTVDAVNLDGLTDDRHEKREALILDALAGKTIEVSEKPAPQEAAGLDLAAVLAASIGAAATPAAEPKKKAAAKKKVAA